jgi:RNA polymerase sigma factor (TIGR02999 family)
MTTRARTGRSSRWGILSGVDEGTDITRLLEGCRDGDERARAELFTRVYAQLKLVARRLNRRAGRDSTLSTTVLVHETYARLAAPAELNAATREHFFALCARAMRQIVIDHARRRAAGKRGGIGVNVALDESDFPSDDDPTVLIALDQALRSLETHDPRLVRLVELRAFAGLSMEEIAGLFGVTVRTVQRDWLRARVWLDAARVS